MPTDALKEFAEYERALATAEAQRRLLPPLPDLAAAVDELNASATNATGRPSEAVAGLNATNVTLSGLPDLPLLISRLGNVYYGQNPNISGHICANRRVALRRPRLYRPPRR